MPQYNNISYYKTEKNSTLYTSMINRIMYGLFVEFILVNEHVKLTEGCLNT